MDGFCLRVAVLVRGREDVNLVVKLENSNNGADREENCVRAMRGRGLAAELLRVEWGDHVAHNFNPIVAGAAGVAIPVDIMKSFVQSEAIRRVAVHVSPRARSGKRFRKTQTTTTESRLLVLVLVERRLRSAVRPPRSAVNRINR